jgi:multicomponent Na+:H+ antiporter subunit B
MLKDHLIVQTILKAILPYIIIYGIYIQLNGEISPGGGFQAGVIFATGLIVFELLYGKEKFLQIFSIELLIFASILGVAIYFFTGIISLFFNQNYLDYYALADGAIFAQHLGIFLVEMGVGITVSAVMILIYIRLS